MRDRIWHRLYCIWYEHRYEGHRVRAAVWGKAADMVCR